jgi:hypothetical protein
MIMIVVVVVVVVVGRVLRVEGVGGVGVESSWRLRGPKSDTVAAPTA